VRSFAPSVQKLLSEAASRLIHCQQSKSRHLLGTNRTRHARFMASVRSPLRADSPRPDRHDPVVSGWSSWSFSARTTPRRWGKAYVAKISACCPLDGSLQRTWKLVGKSALAPEALPVRRKVEELLKLPLRTRLAAHRSPERPVSNEAVTGCASASPTRQSLYGTKPSYRANDSICRSWKAGKSYLYLHLWTLTRATVSCDGSH